jgi:hypothetical protein
MSTFTLLDNSLISAFTSRLQNSIALGEIFRHKSFESGHLRIWVPPEYAVIDSTQLDYDIFYPNKISFENELYEFLDSYFSNTPHGLLIAASPREPQWDNSILGDTAWFSTDSSRNSSDKSIMLYLKSEKADHNMYNQLKRWSSSYQSAWALSSMTNGPEINTGKYYDINSNEIQTIIKTVDHILLGVFDERSMMVWSKLI